LYASNSIEQFLDPQAAITQARRVNDFLAAQVAPSDRYSGFASVATRPG
jgi:hypothetical protein